MEQLGIFAKYWKPGTVKTRLATDIGANAASEIYRAFVVALLKRLAGVASRRVLAFTPPPAQDQFAAIAPGWTLQTQAKGNLGDRIKSYFSQAFDAGCTRVVLLGTDSPNVPLGQVQRAFEVLEQEDVVLGPTTDGGYYLIGMRESAPGLFDNVDWSTPHVRTQTIANARSLKLGVAELAIWYDVDELKDLERLGAELSQTTDVPLLELRETIERALSPDENM